MLQLTANIVIKSDSGSWVFDKVSEVVVEKDIQTLTDTCRITLPRKVKWQGEADIPLRRGDEIMVALGYDGSNTVVFRGYITSIGARTPVEIKCEDEMWRLKALKAVKKAYKSTDIQTLINDQQTGLTVKVFGKQTIGAFRQSKETVAEVLDNLKEQGVRSFFRYDTSGKPILHCGVLFEKQGERVQVFNNQRNMISDDGLTIQNAADVKLKVKAVSLDANNKRTVLEVGDADGEVRTLHKRMSSENELKAWAEQELKRLKRDGLVGSFETFGAVLVDKLDTIGVVLDGIKRGIYQVKKNKITFGSGGFRQSIEIGDRLDAKQ